MLRHGVPGVFTVVVILVLALPWFTLFEHVMPSWPAELRIPIALVVGCLSIYLILGLVTEVGCFFIFRFHQGADELEAQAGSTGAQCGRHPGSYVHDYARRLDARFLMAEPETAMNVRWLRKRMRSANSHD